MPLCPCRYLGVLGWLAGKRTVAPAPHFLRSYRGILMPPLHVRPHAH
jgi:hypothetical protein